MMDHAEADDRTPVWVRKVEDKRVKTLTRRRDHLRRLLDDGDRTDLQYLKSEEAALTWALKMIREAQKRNGR